MKYYHGSQNGNLTELTVEKSNDGYVYLTPDYSAAVLYGACSLRFWDFDVKANKLIIKEIAKDSFKTMYKGVPFYIYSTDDIGEFEESDVRGRKAFRMKHDVKLKEKEFVPDAYEKIMELYNKGELILHFWDDYTEEEKQQKIESLHRVFTKEVMLDEKTRFRDEYELFIKIRPEMKID